MSAHSKLAMAQRGDWHHVPKRTGTVLEPAAGTGCATSKPNPPKIEDE